MAPVTGTKRGPTARQIIRLLETELADAKVGIVVAAVLLNSADYGIPIELKHAVEIHQAAIVRLARAKGVQESAPVP